MSFRAAVIGLGRMGSTFDDEMEQGGSIFLPYCHTPAYVAHPQTELVAGVDPHDEQRAIYGERWGLSQDHLYADHRQMLEKEKQINVVNLLTPSGTHAALGLEVAQNGRHLVVEKPLALRLEDGDRLIETCDHHNVRLFVVKQNRYNRPVLRLRRAIDEGHFGKLVMGTVRVRWCRREEYYRSEPWRGTWAQDGGVFTNQASHHIDLLQWMMGPVQSVFAYTTTALLPIETEDTGIALLKFTNGALNCIVNNPTRRPTWTPSTRS